jgi:hypothetical protein
MDLKIIRRVCLPLFLDEIARQFLDNSDSVFANCLFVHEIVQLRREHSLQEMDAIGHNDAISVESCTSIGRTNLFYGEKLDRVGVVEEIVITRVGVIQSRTDTSRELGHGYWRRAACCFR